MVKAAHPWILRTSEELEGQKIGWKDGQVEDGAKSSVTVGPKGKQLFISLWGNRIISGNDQTGEVILGQTGCEEDFGVLTDYNCHCTVNVCLCANFGMCATVCPSSSPHTSFSWELHAFQTLFLGHSFLPFPKALALLISELMRWPLSCFHFVFASKSVWSSWVIKLLILQCLVIFTLISLFISRTFSSFSYRKIF